MKSGPLWRKSANILRNSTNLLFSCARFSIRSDAPTSPAYPAARPTLISWRDFLLRDKKNRATWLMSSTDTLRHVGVTKNLIRSNGRVSNKDIFPSHVEDAPFPSCRYQRPACQPNASSRRPPQLRKKKIQIEGRDSPLNTFFTRKLESAGYGYSRSN